MDIVYAAENLIDAHLVRNLLVAQGIPAVVDGHYLSGALGEVPVLGLVHVRVPGSMLDQARDLINEVLGAAAPPSEDPDLDPGLEPAR